MSWRYSDYLQVNQDFIDVFSAEEDQQNAQAWMNFIPHQQFLDLLRALLDALERKTPKSLWMHGQYGTGKTMCLFVLKHLLEDDWPMVEAYFDAHDVGPDLRKRIQGIRARGKGLIVYLSGSGYISSNLKLMAALERAVQMSIGLSGGKLVVGSLFESVLARIESQGINWPAMYDENQRDFVGLASSAQDVVDQLRSQRTAQEPRLALLERVVRALEKENIVVLDSAERIKDWLNEVIQVNDYKWIVLMWDEFTEFFLHGAALDGLQEMAQYAAKAPFYLVLATHRPPENLQRGTSDDWKKIRDRFRTMPYLMQSVTANKLMARVIRVLPGDQASWAARKEALWAKAKPALQRLRTVDDSQRESDYADLTPLHPYTAFVLSSIAQQYTSANRTVFRFMKAPGPHGFPEFLRNYPDADWEWYTADGLWDFFFGQADDDTPREFRDGISYYQSRQDTSADDLQRRAFKAMMLLISLEKSLPGEERVRPTLANLSAIFTGTPLRDQLRQVMQALTDSDLVRRVGSATGEQAHYTIQSVNIDEVRLKAIRDKLMPFETLLSTDRIGEDLKIALTGTLSESLKRRLALSSIAFSALKQRRERAIPNAQSYQIATVFVVCEKEDEVPAARELVHRLASENPSALWVLLHDPFGANRFQQYQDDAAADQYYTELKDVSNARFHQESCRRVVSQWVVSLRTAPLTAWMEQLNSQLSGLAGFKSALDSAIEKRFPYRPERIIATDPLYKSGGFGTAGAEVGLGTKPKAAPYDQVLQALGALHAPGRPLEASQLGLRPDHPVTRMKAAVDHLLETDSVDLTELWELLQAPPFGLPPAPVSITLLGLLLRECNTGYYWSDGVTSHALDVTRLAQLIKETMDGKSDQILQKSSLEERRLCALLCEVFYIEDDHARYLLPLRDALRGEIVRRGYPLWALAHFAASCGRPAPAGIDDLCELISCRDFHAFATQERLRQLLTHLGRNTLQLKQLNDPDKYEKGMRYFLRQQEPRVDSTLQSLGLSTKDLMALVKNALEEEVWLWTEEEVTTRIPALVDELELVTTLRDLTGGSFVNLKDGLSELETLLGRGRLPWRVLAHHPDKGISEAIASLGSLQQRGRDFDRKGELARSLRECPGVYQAIVDPVSALRRWASESMGIDLSDAESRMLWTEIPDLSQVRQDEQVQNAVGLVLDALERRRAIRDLRAFWNKHTGTADPDSWSNKHGLPIRWLFESLDEVQALTIVQRPDQATIEAVREAQAVLEAMMPRLIAFEADGTVERRFTESAAGDYRVLLSGDGDVEQLRQHIEASLGKPPALWHEREVRDVATKWIEARYKTIYLPRVQARLDATPAAALQQLLAELAEDPLVGIRLLRLGVGHDL